jgi:hypothetical protein
MGFYCWIIDKCRDYGNLWGCNAVDVLILLGLGVVEIRDLWLKYR